MRVTYDRWWWWWWSCRIILVLLHQLQQKRDAEVEGKGVLVQYDLTLRGSCSLFPGTPCAWTLIDTLIDCTGCSVKYADITTHAPSTADTSNNTRTVGFAAAAPGCRKLSPREGSIYTPPIPAAVGTKINKPMANYSCSQRHHLGSGRSEWPVRHVLPCVPQTRMCTIISETATLEEQTYRNVKTATHTSSIFAKKNEFVGQGHSPLSKATTRRANNRALTSHCLRHNRVLPEYH